MGTPHTTVYGEDRGDSGIQALPSVLDPGDTLIVVWNGDKKASIRLSPEKLATLAAGVA